MPREVRLAAASDRTKTFRLRAQITACRRRLKLSGTRHGTSRKANLSILIADQQRHLFWFHTLYVRYMYSSIPITRCAGGFEKDPGRLRLTDVPTPKNFELILFAPIQLARFSVRKFEGGRQRHTLRRPNST